MATVSSYGTYVTGYATYQQFIPQQQILVQQQQTLVPPLPPQILHPSGRSGNRFTYLWNRFISNPGSVPRQLYIRDDLCGNNLNSFQEYSLKPYLWHPLQITMKNLRIIPTDSFFESFNEDIDDHLESRIHLIFKQMLLVLNTGYQFRCHDTKIQVGSGKTREPAPSVHNKVPTTFLSNKSNYAAAHIAVLPSLKYNENGQDFALGNGSILDFEMNATDLLPIEVNNIDTLIDGKDEFQGKLRTVSLQILNAMAQKGTTISPGMGLKYFIDALVENINAAKKIVIKNGYKLVQERTFAYTREYRKFMVLSRYENVALDYQKKLSNNIISYNLIKKLCLRNGLEDINTILDLNFFLGIQQNLHKQIRTDVFGRSVIDLPIQPPLRSLRIKKMTPPGELEALGPKAIKYQKHCMTNKDVTDLARHILYNPNNGELKKNLRDSIIRTIKNAPELDVRNPQKIDLIMAHIINNVRKQINFIA
ncbi:MAG: hypothetical protein H0W88_11660 [Parachlamydiaceae bacterium]|nr:hypothetical protein [Parachlamydiaceae bacterium]